MKYANLHLHSTYSDAGFTPEQLVRLGKSLGYRALALTDHETDGGVKEFMACAKEEGLDALAGIEFYGDLGRYGLHIVALDYDMDNPTLRAFVRERIERYNEYTKACVDYGIKIGVIDGISWDDVVRWAGKDTWLCIDSVINTYCAHHVPVPKNLRADVFRAPETLCLYPKHPSAEEVIKVIREAGGVAVLAHPHHQAHLVGELVDMGLNGIEVCHPDLDEETSRAAAEAADAYRLYRSGGTDHTGPMSACGGALAVPVFHGAAEEEFFTIKERKLG